MLSSEIQEAWNRLQDGSGFTTTDIVNCLLDLNQRIKSPPAADPLKEEKILREVQNLIVECEVNKALEKYWELVKDKSTLKEAKEQIAQFVYSQIDKDVIAGRKIMAIKLYMRYSGLGLAEAKNYIDNYGQVKFQIAK